MARTVSMEAIEQKITKTQQDVVRTKNAYDAATARLKKLLNKRDALRTQELMKVIADSPLSYSEVLNLISNAGRQAEA